MRPRFFGKSIGLQGRALKSKVIDEVCTIEERGGGFEELIPLLSGQADQRMREKAMWTMPHSWSASNRSDS